MKTPQYAATLAIGAIVVFADQFSKLAVRRHLVPGDSLRVIPGFFNLTHLRNTGAVWGILQQQNEWLIVFSLFALFLIALLYRRLVVSQLSNAVAMGCIVGGVAGNLVDRIKLGWVTDFLDFHVSNYHWPCFNIADAAICVGVAVYIIYSPKTKNGRP